MQRLTKSQSLSYVETRSQAYQDLLDQVKASRIPSIEKLSKACKGSLRLKACFIARPEAKRARICSIKRRRAESQALKTFLKHAKSHQVSKPILWRHEKPSLPGSARPSESEQTPKRRKVSKACKGSPSLKSCFMARPKAKCDRICSTK